MNTPALFITLFAAFLTVSHLTTYIASAIRYSGRDGAGNYEVGPLAARFGILLGLAALANAYL